MNSTYRNSARKSLQLGAQRTHCEMGTSRCFNVCKSEGGGILRTSLADSKKQLLQLPLHQKQELERRLMYWKIILETAWIQGYKRK